MNYPEGVFLGLAPPYCDPETARYAILPVPYEGTVCYGKGTGGGPEAIIGASGQIETYDEELRDEFTQAGVATWPAVEPADDPAEQMRRVGAAAGPIVEAGKFLLTLGGEHSITAPLVQAGAEHHGPLSVLQIDAHADLRDRYDGTRHSHACVMRRVLETTSRICQVGVRSFSREECDQCPQQIGALITPDMIDGDPAWIARAIDMLGAKVYLTIDIDGLDPSIAPGTGTPEPGGLSWRQVTGLLKELCASRQVVAADIVEVSPLPPSPMTEYLAARLAYKIIAYTQQPVTGK